MRRVACVGLTVLAVGIVCLVWNSPRSRAFGQQTTAIQPAAVPVQQPAVVKPLVLSDGLMALSSDTADGKQQVVVIDSKTRVMSVYHVEHATGVITLKSARDISADLLMDEFNTTAPVPSEIRAMLKDRVREKR
jgi:hypothetical protein